MGSVRAAPPGGVAEGPASALDPLIPARVRAVVHWGAGGRPVSIIHDRQKVLSAGGVARLRRMLAAGAGEPPAARVRLVDSRTDPRVQVADIVAGTARRITADELAGRADPELVALARPCLDTGSIWRPDRSCAPLAVPALRRRHR